MDRTLVYAGQVPRALDNLQLGRFAMVGLAKLAEAVLGTSTVVPAGAFSVTPGGGLNIAVSPGQVYQLQNIEPTTQSALNVDGHQVLKQGVALDAQTLTLAPPNAVGYAQNYLIQVAYADLPSGSTVLSFQNPTPVLDPSTNTYKYVTYPGPGGNGAQSYTILQGGVSVIAKPGTAASSGSQTTPPPDAGYVGLFVVTLPYGATSISSGNISGYAGAPFIPVTLPGVPAGVQAGSWTFGQDIGSADNYVVNLAPNPGTLTPNQRMFIRFANPNATKTPVINVNGTGNKSLLLRNGAAPAVGDIPAGWRMAFYDGTNIRLEGSANSELITVINSRPPVTTVWVDPINGNDAADGSTPALARKSIDNVIGAMGSISTAINLLGDVTVNLRQNIYSPLGINGVDSNNNPVARAITFIGTATNSPTPVGTACSGWFCYASAVRLNYVSVTLPSVPAGLTFRNHITALGSLGFAAVTVGVTVSDTGTNPGSGALLGTSNGHLDGRFQGLQMAVGGHLFDGIAGGGNPNTDSQNRYTSNLTSV
jgi:hypothetical protein